MAHAKIIQLALALLYLVTTGVSAQSLITAGDPCVAQRQASYNTGFNDGFNKGYPEGRQLGFQEGKSAGINQCFSDPFSCSITLGSCLAPAQFGETEPNDNIVSADQLVLDVNFLGQSMSPSDQDWYWLVTSAPNQNLTINFSVPKPAGVANPTNWSLKGWQISIRDSRGNRLAGFTTDFVAVDNPAAGLSYRVTLGRVGAYYVVIEPTPANLSYYPYNIATFVQDSGLDSQQYVVGFFDTEVEPNDLPSLANPLANGVSMYGLINLTFDQVVPSGDAFEYAQGEDDWYKYTTSLNELISLTFCGREPCSAGDWYVEVYDQAGATAVENNQAATPLLAFNTNVAITESNPTPQTFNFGLRPKTAGVAETYYMRVDHKRLLAAPCTGYRQDRNNDGALTDADQFNGQFQACGCDSGYSCKVKIPNPGTGANGACPDGSGGGTPSTTPGGQATPAVAQCEVNCRCVSFGGAVAVPEGPITSQYNFSWYGTNLPTSTVDTNAYQDYLNRPNSLGQ